MSARHERKLANRQQWHLARMDKAATHTARLRAACGALVAGTGRAGREREVTQFILDVLACVREGKPLPGADRIPAGPDRPASAPPAETLEPSQRRVHWLREDGASSDERKDAVA